MLPESNIGAENGGIVRTTRSEKITELVKALVAFQAEVKSPVKDKTNPHFKSKYADIQSYLETALPIMSKNGLAVVQRPLHTAPGTLVIETLVLHTSGEWVSGTLNMVLARPNDPQAIGSSFTYARRYMLSSMLGMAAEDDDGNEGAGGTIREREERSQRMETRRPMESSFKRPPPKEEPQKEGWPEEPDYPSSFDQKLAETPKPLPMARTAFKKEAKALIDRAAKALMTSHENGYDPVHRFPGCEGWADAKAKMQLMTLGELKGKLAEIEEDANYAEANPMMVEPGSDLPDEEPEPTHQAEQMFQRAQKPLPEKKPARKPEKPTPARDFDRDRAHGDVTFEAQIFRKLGGNPFPFLNCENADEAKRILLEMTVPEMQKVAASLQAASKKLKTERDRNAPQVKA